MLAEHAPDWDGKPVADDEKPAWFARTVDALAQKIQVNVNRAADVNPINLLALALLSTPKHAMGEADLLRADRAVQDAAGGSAVLRPGDGDPAHAGADHRPRRGDRPAHPHRRTRWATCWAWTATTRCC